jgi:putative MATE family efflux protein
MMPSRAEAEAALPASRHVDRTSLVRSVVRLAAPAIGQQLLHTLVFLVDRAMLGRYDASALAAMQITEPIVWGSFSVLSAFAVGTIAVVGRAVGGGDQALASAAARASLGFAVVAGALAAALGLFGRDALLSLFPAAGNEVHEAARGYLGIVLFALPMYLLSFTSASTLHASGDTRTPFLIAAVGNGLNIALNYVFIFGHFGAPELGMRGAAVGSASSMIWQGMALTLLLGSGWMRVTWRGRGGEWDALRRLWRVATASMGERVVMQLGFFGFALMIGVLGGQAMAANQALLAIEAVCFMSADGVGIAAAAMVAQGLGAGLPEQAHRAARVATRLGVGLLGLFGIVFLLAPEALLGAFSEDPSIVRTGLPCMYLAAAAQPFMATAIVLSETLRGAGATRTALALTLTSGLVLRLGATAVFVFVLHWGLVGVWLGSLTDWVVRALLFRTAVARGHWRETRI